MATTNQQRLTQWWKTEPFRNPAPQTTEHPYDALIAVELLIADGYLDRPVRYFEPGCCLGRNLKLFYDRYDGHPWGLEVHPELVAAVKEAIPSVAMLQANIFDTDHWASSMEGKFFDVTLTRSFLFYLPPGPDKHRVVDELKRISKLLVVMEPNFTNTGNYEPVDQGDYVQSWERWEDYGLIPYPKARAHNLGVYIWK